MAFIGLGLRLSLVVYASPLGPQPPPRAGVPKALRVHVVCRANEPMDVAYVAVLNDVDDAEDDVEKCY